MVAIILAAGKGARLLPLTKDRPKILVDLGDGTTLLSRQHEALSAFRSVNELIIGAGHYSETVRTYLSNLSSSINSQVVHNPFFGTTGPIVTLWIALFRVSDRDFLFMNGDTIFGKSVYSKIDNLVQSGESGIYLFVSKKQPGNSDEIGVVINEENKVVRAEKGLASVDAVSAGLVVVLGSEPRAFLKETIEELSGTEAFLAQNNTWHSLLNALFVRGYGAQPVYVNSDHWKEIDIHFELNEVQDMIHSKVASSRFELDQKRL